MHKHRQAPTKTWCCVENYTGKPASLTSLLHHQPGRSQQSPPPLARSCTTRSLTPGSCRVSAAQAPQPPAHQQSSAPQLWHAGADTPAQTVPRAHQRWPPLAAAAVGRSRHALTTPAASTRFGAQWPAAGAAEGCIRFQVPYRPFHPTPTARVQEPTQACHAPLAKQ